MKTLQLQLYKYIYMYGLLTKCEGKMAGYWPSSSFVCLWTKMESSSINSRKKTGPISRHLDRTNLVNERLFIIMAFGKFFLAGHGG